MIVVVNVKKAINIHDPWAWAPRIFRPNWGPKGQKIFWGRLPPHLLYLRVWMTTHPLISKSGSGTEILQTNLETFPWRISWENLMKDQSISLWWSFFILVTFLLKDVLMLLGENWCWSLLGLNGLLNPLTIRNIGHQNIFPQNLFFP